MDALAAAFIAEGLLEPLGTFREPGLKLRPEMRVVHDLAVEVRAPGSGLFVIIPEGYITDGYSMPGRLLQLFQPRNPRWLLPALLHDWLYDTGLVDRALADAILLEQMRAAGVFPWQRRAVYAGVRAGGWGGFNKPLPVNLGVVQAARKAGLAHDLTTYLKQRRTSHV